MRIALLDDDPKEWKRFTEALRGWDPAADAGCFADGAALLNAAAGQEHFTVAFLDVYLPEENGVNIARKLKKISPDTEIVFVTASTEHAVQAFEIGAVHYLLKPVDTAGIQEVFARLSGKQDVKRPVLSLKVGRGRQMVYMDQILMLTSADHYTNVSLLSGDRITVSSSLSDLYEKLDERFLKLQRGCVVNMEYIEVMQSDRCRLRNGETVLLSRKERMKIREDYNNWVFRRLPDIGRCRSVRWI